MFVGLNCIDTNICVLPELPLGLVSLYTKNTPLILKRENGESIEDYNARWRIWKEEQESRKRIQERTRKIQAELEEYSWSPRRVEKWIEKYGIDILETL